MEVAREDGRWMELAQDRVQWRGFGILAVLNFRVLPAHRQYNLTQPGF
jgi:hypothetical protein